MTHSLFMKNPTMYHIFIVIHSLPLILLPNESLLQMLSNDMLYSMYRCPTESIQSPTKKITKSPMGNKPVLVATSQSMDQFTTTLSGSLATKALKNTNNSSDFI